MPDQNCSGFEQTLSGYRVLDLSQYLPGPYATQILADLGADVLKVEPPGGDPMRSFLVQDKDGCSPWYKQVNAGKKIVQIDLKSTQGQSLFSELIEQADVLLESFRPGVIDRLNFGRERLQKLNPGLIHCALSGFGQNGPCRDRAGHDLTYLAMSGMLNLTGSTESPVIPFPPICDYAAGKQAVTAILAALLRRVQTNEGAYIDVSLFEMALSWQSFALTEASRSDQSQGRGQGLLTGGAACYQIYRTADDRFVVLGAIEKKFWRLFCETVDRPDWIERQQEPLPQTDLLAGLRTLFSSATFDEWCQLFMGIDCCFEPVLEHFEVIAHPHVKQRELIQVLENEERHDALFPVWVDGRPPTSRREIQHVAPEAVLAAWTKK